MTDDLGYRNLAWELVRGATAEYHAFHLPELRRAIVMRRVRGQPKNLQKKQIASMLPRLKERAALAERWMRGHKARYPFAHAAAWLGWDADTLYHRLTDGATGWNLLVQTATTPKNQGKPETERVAEYFESLGDD